MSGPDGFGSPSALRAFALETVSELRAAGLGEGADILEAAATYVTGSGSERLGELGLAVATIRSRFDCARSLEVRLDRIRRAATSREPHA